MNNQEAKFILLAYRANGADATDPKFAEALAQAQRDPELAQWFAQERLLDLGLRNKLKGAVTPPPDLQSHLLALHRMVHHIPWWKRPAWLAAAASVALLLSVSAAWYFRTSPPPVWDFLTTTTQAATHAYQHVTLAGNTETEIKQTLRSHHADAGFELPPALAGQPISGASVIPWKGQSIVMICLTANSTNHVDLFIAKRAGFPEALPPTVPQFQDSCSLATTVWSTPDRIYLLAGQVPINVLQSLSGTAKAPGN